MIFITFLTLITSLMVYPLIYAMFFIDRDYNKNIEMINLDLSKYNKVDVK